VIFRVTSDVGAGASRPPRIRFRKTGGADGLSSRLYVCREEGAWWVSGSGRTVGNDSLPA
jgi:hypothetical protein